jgi:ubiquinone biosynthesis protein
MSLTSGTALFIVSFPAVFLMAWVAGRLLGTRHSWLATLASGVTGWIGGVAFAVILHGGDLLSGGFTLHVWLFSIVFTMTALAAFDMVARPGAFARAQAGAISIPRPLRALRRRSQRVRRYAQLTRILARQGLGPYLGLAGEHDEDAGRRTSLGHRLSHALEEAGGMFVKLGQVASTRTDLLPPGVVAELARLQDRVRPAPQAGVQALIETELGSPVEAIFASFEWTPVAAASIGQAHRAQLRSGEPVIVKVQRPGIEAAVQRDLDVLLQFAKTVEARTSWGADYQVLQFATDFADRVREELDFRIEARNATEIAANLAGIPQVHVPRVYDELSTSRVLVMEWLDGVNVRQGDRIDGMGLDRRTLADALLRCSLQQMLIDGHFHADPHPGNVMVLSDGRIGLIDFGAASRLDAQQMASLREMIVAIGRRDAGLVRQAVLQIATLRKQFDDDQLERALARFVARRLGPGAKPNAAMLNDMMQIFFTFGVSLPSEFGTLFRALITLEGTLTALCPGYYVIDEAQKLAAQWVGDQLSVGTLREMVTKEVLELAPLLRRLPRHVDRIATQLERGSLAGRISLLSDADDVRTLTRLVNRFVLAFIGTVGGIISVILIGTQGGPHFTGDTSLFQFFGYFGLFWCLVLILRVVVAILHDGIN